MGTILEQGSVSSTEHSYGGSSFMSSPSSAHCEDTPPSQQTGRKGGVVVGPSSTIAGRAGSVRGGGGGGGGGGDNKEEQRWHQQSLSCLDIASADILTHISDSQVKPIVNNRAIETIEKHTYSFTKNSSAHFQPLSLEQLSSLSQAKIESHLSHVSVSDTVSRLSRLS